PVDVYEVGHVPEADAVDEVPDRPPRDQGQRDASGRRPLGQPVPLRDDQEEDGRTDHGQQERLPRQSAGGEDAEGHAAGAAVDEAEETGDDLVDMVETELAPDQRLGELVEGDDGQRAGGLEEPEVTSGGRQAPIVTGRDSPARTG